MKEPLAILREAGGIGDIVRMYPIIAALAEKYECTWYVTSRFEQVARMCPAIMTDRADLHVLKIEGVARRSSRGPLFTRWGQVVDNVPYFPAGAHNPGTKVVDLYCPAFIHEIQTGGRPTMDRLECWARAAGVWPVKPQQPALSAFDRHLADLYTLRHSLPLSRMIGISATASVGVRTYRWDRIGSLIEALKRDGWTPVVFDGAGGTPVAACHHSFSDDLRQQFSLLAICRAFVGPDSGFLHAALCLGVPSVGYFGPTEASHICGCYDPKLWRQCTGVFTPQIKADKGCSAACYCLNAGGFKAEKCSGSCAVLESIPEATICEELGKLLGDSRSLRILR